MFVSTKPTSPHEDHTRTDRIRNSCAHFLCVSCWDIRCHACNTKEHVLRDTSCRNPELNRVPKINLSYLQHISIFCPSGKYKLLIRSFLRYHNTIHFMHNIVPLKRIFGAWYKGAQNFFSPGFDNNFNQVFYL